MKKLTLTSLSITALVLGLAGTTAFAHEGGMHTHTAFPAGGYNVMVMKHLCNSSIRNMEDFKALEAGRDPVGALANTVLNCPTTALPGDMAVENTVASPRMTYDFTIKGEHQGEKRLSKDGKFMQYKLSEADINKDVDGNGTISSDTALDISHYEFPYLMADNGRVEVTENTPPAGFRFGTVRFTPLVIDGNNDEQSLLSVDEAQGRIQLNLTNDADKMVMLHIYNFRTGTNDASNNGNTGNTSGTTTSATTTGSTTTNSRAMIVSQINSLQQQIQSLFAQIQNLLGQL